MSGFEIVGLVLGVVGLVPIFKEGYVMVKQYRHKRKLKFLASNSSTSTLKHTLGDSSTALTTRYDSLYSSYGAKFATGDSTSREELSKIIIILQGEIIVALRMALTGGTLQNPDHLNSVAAKSREDAIAVLGQLAQRIAIASPILPNLRTPKKLFDPSWRQSFFKENPRKQLESTSRIQEIDVPTGGDGDSNDTSIAQARAIASGVPSRRRDHKQGSSKYNSWASSDEEKESRSIAKEPSSPTPPEKQTYKMGKSIFREKSPMKMAAETPNQQKFAIVDAKPETETLAPKNQQKYPKNSPQSITKDQTVLQSDKKDQRPTFWDKIGKTSATNTKLEPLTQKASADPITRKKQEVLDSSSDDEEYETAKIKPVSLTQKASEYLAPRRKQVVRDSLSGDEEYKTAKTKPVPLTKKASAYLLPSRKQVVLDSSSDDEEYEVKISVTKSEFSKKVKKRPQPTKRTAASGYNKYIDSDDEKDTKYLNINNLMPKFSYSSFTGAKD
ncbi:hypothetical protein TWF281_000856 [Arthrobotrys megalospora]